MIFFFTYNDDENSYLPYIKIQTRWKLPLKYEFNVTVAIFHLVHILKWNIVLVTRMKYVICEDFSAIVRVYTSNKNDKEYLHGSMYFVKICQLVQVHTFNRWYILIHHRWFFDDIMVHLSTWSLGRLNDM